MSTLNIIVNLLRNFFRLNNSHQIITNYPNKDYYDIDRYENGTLIGTVRMHTMKQNDYDEFQKMQHQTHTKNKELRDRKRLARKKKKKKLRNH